MALVSLLIPGPQTSSPIYTVTLTSPPDHRLTSSLIKEFLGAFDEIERDWRDRRKAAKGKKPKIGGAIILRGEGEKFFSNGLDYENTLKDPNFHPETFSPFILRVLTFPLITIAAINGHAFAGGFLLSMAADFRVMREEQEGRRSWGCMNEVDFGAPLPPLFAELLRQRIPPQLLRSVLLGTRLTANELSSAGVVDALAPSDEALMSTASSIAEKYGVKASEGAWGLIKAGVWKGIVDAGQSKDMPKMPPTDEKEAEARLSNVKVRQSKL